MSFAEKYGKKSTNTAQKIQKKSGAGIDELLKKKKEGGQKASQMKNKKNANADLIYLVKGIDDGRNAWYYVLVDRLKVSLFLKALNDDIIHLENYGKILYSAYGDEPPKDITDKIKEEYGVEDV